VPTVTANWKPAKGSARALAVDDLAIESYLLLELTVVIVAFIQKPID
jgi:hypothetical protein